MAHASYLGTGTISFETGFSLKVTSIFPETDDPVITPLFSLAPKKRNVYPMLNPFETPFQEVHGPFGGALLD